MNNKSYLEQFGGQLPAIGVDGQRKLGSTTVCVAGLGRVGSAVVFNLACSGVSHIIGIDPQRLNNENLGHSIHAGKADRNRPKAMALDRFLLPKDHIIFEPVVATLQSGEGRSASERCHYLICCANELEARITAEVIGMQLSIPTIQLFAFDGRRHLGGGALVRLPENDWGACLNCLLPSGVTFERGEGLLTTVTAAIGAIGANMVVQLVTGIGIDYLTENNFFVIDLLSCRIEPNAIGRRSDCFCSNMRANVT